LKCEHLFTIIEPMEPTRRQRQILDFIQKRIDQEGISPSIREICEHFGLKSPSGVHRMLKSLEKKGYISPVSGKKRAWRPTVRRIPFRKMPVLGRIAAGLPVEAQRDLIEELPVDCSLFGNEGCFGLYVKGDSMIGAHIEDGDIAVICPCPDIESGQIAAVQVEDLLTEATLKIVKKTSDAIELHAANPAYKPLVFKKEDAGQVRILGKLAGIIRRKG